MSGGLLSREEELAAVERVVDAALERRRRRPDPRRARGHRQDRRARGRPRPAAERGALVLGARASELDRGFGFGLVHQLFDRAVSDELLTGAAAHAAVVLAPAAAPAEDAGFAVLHGLYWLVANLADERPVVLLADDLHWADLPSARFLEYLGRRLDGLPVALVATTRPNEPGAPAELLDELRAGPRRASSGPARSPARRPRRCSRPRWARSRTRPSSRPHSTPPAATRCCCRCSRARRRTPASSPADGLAELGARGVAPAVERRLRPLGADAVAAARAVAVLGERATADDVAALAGLTTDVARPRTRSPAAAEVLDGRAFVHPLVRAAVLDACPAGERAALHRAAAVRLRERGLRPGAVAPHWRAADPMGTSARSRTCAPRRARPPPRARPTWPRTTSPARWRNRPSSGSRSRSSSASWRSAHSAREGPSGCAACCGRAWTATPPRALTPRSPTTSSTPIRSPPSSSSSGPSRTPPTPRFCCAWRQRCSRRCCSSTPTARLRARIETGMPSLAALAHAANDGALRGLPTPELVALCERALAGGALLASVGPASSTWNLVTHALRFAEDARGSQRALEAGDRAVREQGLLAATLFVEQSWGYWHRDFGSVALGAARSRSGLEAIQGQGMVTTVPALSAVLAENLVELDRLEEAAAEIDVDLGPAEGTFIEPFVLTIRGRVRLLLRRFGEAEADLRRVVAFGDARGWAAPNATRGRLRLAEVLAASGRPEEALALMDHDVAAATAAQRPGCLGMALRRRALAQEGEEAIATLARRSRPSRAPTCGSSSAGRCTTSAPGCGSAAIAAPPANRCAGRSTSGTARSPRCWPATRTASSRPRAPARAASGWTASRRSRPPSVASRSSPPKG